MQPSVKSLRPNVPVSAPKRPSTTPPIMQLTAYPALLPVFGSSSKAGVEWVDD